MAHVALTAQKRTEFGNGPTRRLRRRGLVPGVVYQPGSPSMAFTLSERELRRAIAEGRTGVIDLTVEGDHSRPVLLKDWQLDPVRGDVLHVDFQEVDLTQEVEAPVQIVLVGSSVGVRDGGVLDQTLREVLVRALPDALPDHLELDVSETVFEEPPSGAQQHRHHVDTELVGQACFQKLPGHIDSADHLDGLVPPRRRSPDSPLTRPRR